MRIAISMTMTEPPIESAASERPTAARKGRPKNIARRSIPIAIMHSRKSTRTRRLLGTPFMQLIVIGILPRGSAISTISMRPPQKLYSIAVYPPQNPQEKTQNPDPAREAGPGNHQDRMRSGEAPAIHCA